MKKKKNMTVKSSKNAKKKTKKTIKGMMKDSEQEKLVVKNPDAAGVDIGSEEHWVSVPPDRVAKGEDHAKPFGCFTSDLHKIVGWLRECGIKTVALESTGVYWIPLFQILESAGFEVCLVNTKHLKNVNGRPKTDRLDCVWLMRLHSYGLLFPSFRPADEICALRAYTRLHDTLVLDASDYIRRMGKTFQQMNVRLDKAITDLTGKTGTQIIEAIIKGEKNATRLAKLRDRRCKKSEEEIAEALSGDFRDEHVYVLKSAYRMYNEFQDELRRCEAEIDKRLRRLTPSPKVLRDAIKKVAAEMGRTEPDEEMGRIACEELKPDPSCDMKTHLSRLLGVDATEIPGFDVQTIITLVSEVGLDLAKWRTAAQFASWLGLSPNPQKSGISKNIHFHTKKVQSRAAQALRTAAQTVHKTKTFLGDRYRSIRARCGAPVAVTAIARKLAVIYYNMVTRRQKYNELGMGYRNKRNPMKYVSKVERTLKELGFQVVPMETSEQVAINI